MFANRLRPLVNLIQPNFSDPPEGRFPMRRLATLCALLLSLTALAPATAAHAAPTPIQVYGAWHCSNDACTWSTVRTVAEFDSQNHWLIDRGTGQPSVNL